MKKLFLLIIFVFFFFQLNSQTISTFPHLETFSSFTTSGSNPILTTDGNWWFSSTSIEPMWELEAPTTGVDLNTSFTGPIWDHTTIGVAGGRYVFLETDNGSLGSFSYLTSPNLNYSPNQILKLSFWYHMYGSAIGSLEVEQYVNGGWMSTGWHKTGQQHTTGVAAWTEAQIVLNSAATKIRFKGARGNSYTGDIAIDDIYFSIVTTNNSGISNINAPGGIITPGSYNININIKNFGTDTLSSATIKYSVNGGTIYSYSWSGSIDSGATLSNITIGNHTFIAGQSDLLVWTESPNGVTDQDMDNDTAYLSVYACNSLSGVYLIGKTNSDFPTINDAISAIQSCNISGSVTFNISPDVYNENILLQPISGLSSTKTVTFQSLTGNPNDVIIKHSSVNSSSNYVVKLNGADYFKFKNLTLQSLNPNYGIVVEIKADANNNEFSGNRLIGVSTTKTNEVMAVIISDNSIDNYNVIQNNEIKNGSYGVCFKGASSTVLEQGLIISNNTITNFVKYGIFIQYSNSINITSNLIKSNIANDKYGIYIENGDNAQNISSNNIQLEGSGWLYGIYLKNCDGTTANPGKVFNNFVTLYDATSSLEGITSFTCNYQNYYFNSVHVSTTGSNGYCFIHGGGNVNIVNNILSNTGKGYTFYISGNFTVSTVDYNNLYCTDSILAYWGGNRATLNDLKLFSGKNMHSKSVNPHFVSSSDLHINNQLLNGMGTTIAGITTDIDGDTRSSPPDIGADEFYPLSSDAGISDYLGPFGSCPGYPDSVTVKLKNYGYANLTNVTVNWKVNGVLKTPFNWTGILPAYSDTDITIGTHTFLSNSNSNMVFWTTNPNSVTDLNNTNDTLNSINIPMAMAPGTYIIGSGPSADFSSFNEAITAMYSYGICGSITFNVESGTYTEQVYLNELFGLDSGRTVTFKSLTGNPNDVVLMYDATYLPNNCVINFDGADYFQFKNMTIKATSNISSKVIFLTNNACYNEISNNIIINNSNQPNIHVIGSLSNNNKILNNEILNGTYGIHIESSNTISAEGNTILGNNISNFTTCGIKVTYNNSLTIDSNTISLNQQVYNSEGIVLNNCDSGLFVVRNRINSSVIPISSGIVLEFCDGTSSSPSFVANNFISQSYSASNKFYGIELHSSNHINIYYNSVNITAGSYNSTAIYQYNGSNLNIVNNNFVNVGGGYAIWSNQPSSISNLDYNNYYVSGNYIAYWGYHTYYATLASFKTASNKDFNSISVNPMFPSLQNLHLNSSSLNGAGTPLSGIYDDIDGDTRSSTAPDIGADEYDIVFNDAGISALIHPNVACLGVNNIIVKLKNYGPDTLFNAAIHWSVNDTIQQVFNWTGSLASLEEDTVNIGTYTFNNGVQYIIKVWSVSPNNISDVNNYNDTLSVSGINIALPSGPFIIGSSPSADYTSFTSAINDLNQHGICGPTVFNVEAGTYNEQLVLNQVLGVSPNNTITFQSVSGNNSDVILTYNSSSSSNYVIQLDGGDFFIFKNMTIKATNYNYSRVIDVNQNSNFNEFIGNKIIGVNGPGVNLNNPNIFINEVNTDNNSFINNTIEYGSDGFYINGASSNYISGILIEGNSIINCSQSIYLRYIETSNIRSNTIMQSSSSNSTVIFSYKCGEGMKYEKNKITMTTSGNCLGIWLNLCTSTTQSPTYITNNFIIKTGISNQENKGIRIEQSNNINVYYNSVNITSGSVNSTAFYYVSGNNINVKNNIFCNTGIGYTMYYNSPPNTANFSSDNNNLYTVGNKFIYLSGDRSNLLAYQQYSNMDANSVSVIPGFISPSDLHIFNTTLNGVGYIITEITDDYDGDIRSSTNPDIGADEYNMFLNDVGPISVDLPINPTFAGTKNFKISIQNFGSNQLTTTTINWKVDNVLKTPFVWTGSLTHLSKDSLISIGSHNLTMGNHTITIWTSLPNNVSDQYPNNDTITYQISVIALPNIDVSLNALNITVTNCNDSIIVPIVIKNTGQSWLNFSVGDQNPDTVEILALIHGYQSTYFNNLLSSVDAYFTKYNITTTTSTNNTTMQSLLIGKDLVIIPFVVTTIGVSQIQSLFPILQTYVNNGGTVLFMGQYYGSQLVLGSGMFSGTLYGTTNSKTMNIMNSNHPVTNSVASSFASGNYDFWMYTITNSNAVKLVEASFFGTPYEVITYRRIGNGYAIINGFEFDYLSTNNNIKKLIANTFKWSKTNTNPKWLQRSFMQDSISGSDSSIVNIEFNSNGLSNGTYITSFKILSNDAQQPVTHIPCTLNVIGSPDISVATNLVTFPSTPIGSVASDSVVVTNNGCDNLVITSITSNSNQFTVNGLVGSDTILPGDFKVYYINFSPTTVGAIIGAVTILSNDTNALISLSGTGVGAPNISVLPSLNVTIPFCNDSVNVPYTIKNIGQLSLNVNVESDTIEILALIHGYWSNYWNNYINSISSYVNKFNLDTTTTTDTVVLKNLLLGKDMVFIPNINDLSGVNQIQALSPILQYYVNNGGTVLFAGQYTNNSQLVFGTGFFTGTSSGRVTTSQTINVINSNHPITNGVSSSSPTGNVILYKYIITNNDAVKLVQSTIMGTTYDIVAYRKIGNGYVVVNSLDYNYPPSSDIQKLLANTVLWSKTNTNSDWLEITNSQYLIQPSDSVIINIEFNSKNLAIGTHMSSFNIKSNDIQTPNLIIPCTLTAQNLLQNSVNLGNDTTVCGSYTLNAGLYNNYLWNTNDTSATINVTSTGTYSVTVSNGHCIDADTISFMNIAPIVTMSGLSPSYCENNSPDTLFVSPLGGTFSGNGVTGNIFNPPAAGYGTHTITYSYTDSLSVCTSKDSMNTTIIGGFIAELGSDTTICYGESLVINTSGGPIYLWSTGDTTNSIIVSPSVDSIFAVTVSDINSICSSSDTVTVFVDHPIVDIGSDTSIKMTYESVLLNAGTGFSSYLWDDNSTNQTRQIVGSNVGAGIHNYYVDVTDNNGCMASDTIIVEVIDDTGIINNNFGPSFNFYPNPTSGKIAVDLGKTYKSVDLTVRNLVGQIVLNKNYKSTNQLSFDMKGSTGVYFVEIRTDEGKSGVFKVVKE